MSNSKSKILVPYDFSDNAENALNLAYQIAGRGEYDIILYHTIEVPHYPYVEPEFKDSHTSQLLDMATALLTTVVKNMSSDQINVKQQVETGSTSGSILNFIKKEKINLVIIGLEIFLITHLFMGLLAGSAVQVEATNLFLAGEFTLSFWVLVLTIGLLIPAIIEFMEVRGKHINKLIVPLLVVIGGLMLRIIMVNAGQVSSF